METKSRRMILTLVFVFAVGEMMQSQDLQEQIAKLGREAAIGYVSPILSAWGNDLNSALYYSADLHDILGFDIGIKIAASRFSEEDKTFQLTLPPQISVRPSQLGYTVPNDDPIIFTAGSDYDPVVTINSAVGSKEETSIKFKGNRTVTIPGYGPVNLGNKTLLVFPGGYEFPGVGVLLMMPQLAVGLPLGFEVMLRYVPTIDAGDAGKFNYIGFGLRYDIDQWLPFFPLDIAAHFMTQKMTFKSKANQNLFSANAVAGGIEVSKRLFILTLYGGFQLESSKLKFEDFSGYDPATATNVTYPGFEIKGSNTSRFTVGARLLLLIVNAHIEYSFAKNPVLAAGLGISFR